MIYTVTLNPALDKTATVENLRLDSVNRISELRVDPGGKGINVSKVVRELGAKTVAIALLGGHTGTMLRNMLAELGIECKVLEVEGETRTNLKIKDPALKTNTDINEPGPEVTDEQLRGMLDGLVGEVGGGDIVVLSGSLPRGAAADTYKVWVAALKKTGAKVYLDADGDKLVRGIEAKPDLIKPNEIELGAMMGRTLDADEKIVEAARELIDGGLDRVMVSMGGAGALYVARDVTIKANPVKVPVGSTVGAGDSVVAALAYAQDKGLGLEDTMRLAMATGAANVMQSGTQAAPRELVDSLIDKVVVTRL
ncbi:phosphofructokinase [Olsenella sp. oral taxon 807]|jgi:1-phosphofructokinase|uniref:1-phosphofructokinase n=1 Tax=Olsenella sp. oral taxon 807 TaxID=712411 RepID=UPI000679EADE|nr:1-phosphofructokinase [Olsenella sp. oral taxon 807]AKT49438.1 phosphofructokinase [Olsenella sp. oral taxon 807]